MRIALCIVAVFGLLVGCSRTEEDVQADVAYIERYGFRQYDAVLASEPRSAKGLENCDVVWFQFRMILRGEPGDINKWPAVAPTDKYHRGDRVKLVAFGAEGLFMVAGHADPERK